MLSKALINLDSCRFLYVYDLESCYEFDSLSLELSYVPCLAYTVEPAAGMNSLLGLSTGTAVVLGANVLFGENDAISEREMTSNVQVSPYPNENCIVCFYLSPIKSVSFSLD